MISRTGLAVLLGLVAAAPPGRAAPDPLPPAAAAVRAEALKSNGDPGGRPLPLAAHWHSGHASLEYQLDLLGRGHHILPFAYMLHPSLANDTSRLEKVTRPGMEAAFRKLAEWKMPFVLITGGQWEADLYTDARFRSRPPGQNPCVVDAATGEIRAMVSPFGPVEAWRELGRQWGGTAYFKWLAGVYPDPPRVVLVSNNEANRLRWHMLENEKRYMEKYGAGRSDDFKRTLITGLYHERYRALFEGLREALPNEHWRKHVVFAGYNGGPGEAHLGRGPGLEKWILSVEEDLPPRNTWEGALPESYDNPWEHGKFDHRVWSCQTEAMNLVFQRKRALRADPEWWMESIFWDGGDKRQAYEKKGLSYTPERYAAWAAFVLWTLTPRVARQWNASNDPRENWIPQFGALMRNVDRIHKDPVLSRFWRKGELVENPEGGHPYVYRFPEKWRNEARWFRLTTDRDPSRPWTLETELPVFALARVIGEKPAREWLLYAHAPLGDLKAVAVTLPDYRPVAVAVPFSGAFYHVREADGAVVPAGGPPSYGSNRAPEARPDAYAVASGETLRVSSFRYSGGADLLRNDTDYEGDALAAEAGTPPANGTLSLEPDGAFTYVPKKGFTGVDGFTYGVSDGQARSGSAAVTIRVLAAPAAVLDEARPGWNTTTGEGHKGSAQWTLAREIPKTKPGEPAPVVDSEKAGWRAEGLAPGTIELFATWPSHPEAGKVFFEAYEGTARRLRAEAVQTDPPRDLYAAGTWWNGLGTVTVTGSALRIELPAVSVKGKPRVIADSVALFYTSREMQKDKGDAHDKGSEQRP